MDAMIAGSFSKQSAKKQRLQKSISRRTLNVVSRVDYLHEPLYGLLCLPRRVESLELL